MIAYLDNSATTKPCALAVERINAALTEGYHNPSSLYAPSIAVERQMKATREQILASLGARASAADIVFTSGGTEANNLAILGSTLAMRGPVRLITSPAEHPSVLRAFEHLEEAGHGLTLIQPDLAGQPDWEALERALGEGPALISMMHVNNETGAVLDIARLSALARRVAPNALIHVDGVQSYLRLPIDVRLIDLYSLSGHKIHAPKGIGALLVRKGVRLKPRQFGGGQENALRAGTENTPGIAALSGAVEHMRSIEGLQALLMGKKLRFYEGLKARIDDLMVNGPDPEHGAPHILNLSFPGVKGEVLLHAMEGLGIYCSTGSACSSKKRKLSGVLLSMGIPPDRAECALRFSFSPDTQDDQIDYAIDKIAALHGQLKRFRRK